MSLFIKNTVVYEVFVKFSFAEMQALLAENINQGTTFRNIQLHKKASVAASRTPNSGRLDCHESERNAAFPGLRTGNFL